jgi:hypothetical protein
VKNAVFATVSSSGAAFSLVGQTFLQVSFAEKEMWKTNFIS